MTRPRACVVKTDGINRDAETVRAFELVDVAAEVVHVNQLAARPERLLDYAILAIPGGFSYGDDVGAGRVLAAELVARLGEAVGRFIDDDGLVMGICNGFQVLVRTGLLPHGALQRPTVSLAGNDSGRFECRWTRMVVEPSHCVMTSGCAGQVWEFPVAHGEGRLLAPDPQTIERLGAGGHVVLRYVDSDDRPTERYPDNPNGSPGGITALTDATGRILGLMPHPECFVERHQHPNWRRRNRDVEPDGLWLFRNAAQAAGLRSARTVAKTRT